MAILPDTTTEARPGEIADGFNMTARDFDRAVALARLTGLQSLLVQRARELSWTMATLAGEKRARSFRINLTALANFLGCKRQAVSRAHAELLSMGVFVPAKGAPGRHRINKDFRGWKALDAKGKPTGPILTPDMVRFALKAKELRRSGEDRNENVADRNENVAPPPADRNENVAPPATKRLHPRNEKVAVSTKEERARVGETEERLKRDTLTERTTGEDSAAGGWVDSVSIPEQIEAICRRAESIPSLRAVAFGPKLRGAWQQDGDFAAWWESIPVQAWSDALNDLAGKPEKDRHPRFYLGIVKKSRPRPAAPEPRLAAYNPDSAPPYSPPPPGWRSALSVKPRADAAPPPSSSDSPLDAIRSVAMRRAE